MSFFRNLMGGGVPAVTVQEAAELQGDGDGALIVDVREPNEYAQVRAEGAVLLPLGQLNSARRGPASGPRAADDVPHRWSQPERHAVPGRPGLR